MPTQALKIFPIYKQTADPAIQLWFKSEQAQMFTGLYVVQLLSFLNIHRLNHLLGFV